MKRLIQLLTLTHRVHHIHFGYGWVFLPVMIGYFPDYKEVYRLQKATAWKVVNLKHFHSCSWTGVY